MSDEAILDGFRHLESYMAELFRRTEQRFDSFDARFEGIERRLDRVEVKLIDLEQKVDSGFSRVGNQLAQLDERVTSMELKNRE